MLQGELDVCVNGTGYKLYEGDSLTYDSPFRIGTATRRRTTPC